MTETIDKSPKQILRRQMSKVAKTTPGPDAQAVAKRICSLPEYLEADYVLGYVPLKSEVDVTEVMDQAVRDGKTIAFPDETPGLFRTGNTDWKEKITLLSNKTGSLDTSEVLNFLPNGSNIDSSKKGIILVPGLAFTEFGTRLGRGAGYYDQFFAIAEASAVTNLISIGVCKAAQLVQDLPTEPHDHRVDVVITF